MPFFKLFQFLLALQNNKLIKIKNKNLIEKRLLRPSVDSNIDAYVFYKLIISRKMGNISVRRLIFYV
jgi:hypothetical protein